MEEGGDGEFLEGVGSEGTEGAVFPEEFGGLPPGFRCGLLVEEGFAVCELVVRRCDAGGGSNCGRSLHGSGETR